MNPDSTASRFLGIPHEANVGAVFTLTQEPTVRNFVLLNVRSLALYLISMQAQGLHTYYT